MKRNGLKRAAGLALALVLTLACLCAAAEQAAVKPAAVSETVAKLLEVWDFKFHVRETGIGTGTAPVYTAPSKDAVRLSDGKASCRLGDEIAVAGYTDHWLMVRYEIKDKKVRVGYIPPKYVRNYKSHMAPHFGYIPAVADDTIPVTDNPMAHGTSFAELAPGEAFHVISRYNYHQKKGLDWWYIEFEVDGQVAYGFIEYADAQFHLGEPEKGAGSVG